MANRARPMPDYYVRSVVLAELRRAEAAGRHIDRHYLRSETGVRWDELERRIADARLELDEKESERRVQPATDGGAIVVPGTDLSPTKEPNPDPFAPPKKATGKASQ